MRVDREMTAEIVRMSLPIIIGMISHTVLNLVDTAMVGRLGDVSLAAVGLGSYFILVMILIFGSLNIGTQAITSRRLGEGKSEEFMRIACNASFLALAIGLVVSLAGYHLSGFIFGLLSGNKEIVGIGTPYMRIRFFGLFAMITLFTLRGFVFGVGRVRIDMAVSVLINLLNIFLNWCLIFGHLGLPRLEVSGAALASVISTMIGVIIYITLVYFRVLRDLPRAAGGLISASLMGQMVRISTPRAIQSLSVMGFIVFLSLIGRMGVGELAISNIIFKAFNLAFMLGMAVGTASGTLVGRSLGEGDAGKAARYGWHSAGIGALFMGFIGALFMFFPRAIMGIFSDSPNTIEMGVLPFQVLGAFQLIDGIGIVLSRTLQGAGSTMFVMVSEMFCILVVFIPATWIAVEVLEGDLFMAWASIFLYIIFFASIMSWKFRQGGWKKVRI